MGSGITQTGNRARENRGLQKKCVFCHSEATIVVTRKARNLDVQIWAFFWQIVFSLQ